jgi:hypothetical protein
MSSIRNFAYAALLAAASLSYAPTLASGQEPAHGHFTLAHQVNFGNARLPVGEYEFSYDPNAVSPVLNLMKLSGTRARYMVLVSTTQDSQASDTSKLLVESTPEGSYVSAMQLPRSGMTLLFRVPSHAPEKQIARAVTTASAGQ